MFNRFRNVSLLVIAISLGLWIFSTPPPSTGGVKFGIIDAIKDKVDVLKEKKDEYEFLHSSPSNLVASTLSCTQVSLSWQDNFTNEQGFKIERKIDAGTYSQIATVGADVTLYKDTGLNPNTKYYYRIRAYSTYGNSNYSNEANTTTLVLQE